MLKPFYIKKKNIDNRLLPAVTAADAGKVLGVTEEGKFGLVEGGGGADFSSIRGRVIELTVTNNVISAVEVDNVSVTPSDFFAMPYVDIILTLSYITVYGLQVNGDNVTVSFNNGVGNINDMQIWISGLFTYDTPDGYGLGEGNLLITREGLEVDFDVLAIFVTP